MNEKYVHYIIILIIYFLLWIFIARLMQVFSVLWKSVTGYNI